MASVLQKRSAATIRDNVQAQFGGTYRVEINVSYRDRPDVTIDVKSRTGMHLTIRHREEGAFLEKVSDISFPARHLSVFDADEFASMLKNACTSMTILQSAYANLDRIRWDYK